MFTENLRWTELKNVPLTVQASLSSACKDISFSSLGGADVTLLTSLHGVFRVDNDVTSLQEVTQMKPALGSSFATDPDNTWTAQSSVATCSAIPISSTYQTLFTPVADHSPLIFAVNPASSDDGTVVTASSWSPPSPPDSQSSSPRITVRGSPAPPPYSAQTPSPPPYPAGPSPHEPVLTRKTRRPRKTHPNCTTIKYHRKNCRPDLEQHRTHYCQYPGMLSRHHHPS